MLQVGRLTVDPVTQQVCIDELEVSLTSTEYGPSFTKSCALETVSEAFVALGRFVPYQRHW